MAEKTNMKVDVSTYDGMIGAMKWGSVAVAILVGVIIWLIAA